MLTNFRSGYLNIYDVIVFFNFYTISKSKSEKKTLTLDSRMKIFKIISFVCEKHSEVVCLDQTNLPKSLYPED